ncbi:MAG: YopX family protein [Bacteroidales bacterium]|nr:YopX family protein [Bacteroidales bacterium]
MRSIKFRGKRLDNGEWVYGSLTQFHHPDGDTATIATQGVSPSGTINPSYCVNPDTVGQFTGLTDRDGNEIYEGDIVEMGDLRYRVFYKESHAQFWATTEDFQSMTGGAKICDTSVLYFLTINGTLRVIGNVFDTPDLLKGGSPC